MTKKTTTTTSTWERVKGTVHPKMKVLSFTHPQIVCSVEHKRRNLAEYG